MTTPMQHLHRPPTNDRTVQVAAATAQGRSLASRDVPVTLPPVPWERAPAPKQIGGGDD